MRDVKFIVNGIETERTVLTEEDTMLGREVIIQAHERSENSDKNFFEKIVDSIKAFFENIANFFRNLFGN